MAKLPEIQFGFELGILEEINTIDNAYIIQFRNLSNYDYYAFASMEEGLVRLSEQGWQLRCSALHLYKSYYFQREKNVSKPNVRERKVFDAAKP